MGIKIAVKGECTNARTGEKRSVDLELELMDKEVAGLRWLKLHGGPTGYESFSVQEDVFSRMMRHGWMACAGTEGRWDSLFIPADEMRRTILELGAISALLRA